MDETLRDKLIQHFGDLVVDKREALHAGFERMPRFVTEFLLAKARSKNADLSVREVRERLARHWIDADQKNLFLSKLMTKREETLIALLEIEAHPNRGTHTGRIVQLDGNELVVPDSLSERYPELLTGGLWGSCALGYDTTGKTPKIVVNDFTPYQLTRPDMSAFTSARSHFSTEEWIEILLTSAGYRPEAFPDMRRRLLALTRLVPLVQPNVNLIELGPRGTGKSYLLRNLSQRVYLVAGARATPASLLYDLRTNAVGIIGRKKVVVFDEIGSTAFPDASLVAAMKDYMESGQIARGGRALVSDCSIVFAGNLDIGADGLPSRGYLHLFEALPDELSDTAIADRIHAFVPGWELPKIGDDVLADGHGFLTDYFGEVLGQLRNETGFIDHVRAHAQLENSKQRDKAAIERVCAGLLKLLYPNGAIEQEGFVKALSVATELRQRVHHQLSHMSPGEFPKKQISFPGIEPSPAPDLGGGRSLVERDIEANDRDLVGKITILLMSDRGGGDVGFVECSLLESSRPEQITITGLRGPVLE